jgi:hypothetical protein
MRNSLFATFSSVCLWSNPEGKFGWKAAIDAGASCAECLEMKAVRYAFYLAFALGALIFWALFAFFVLGWVPFADPACTFDPGGCPPPTFWLQLFNMVVVFGAIPVSVLLFVFYRRWVRRKLGMEEQG